MHLLSGSDPSSKQQKGGGGVDSSGEEQSDLDFKTEGLLARQLLRTPSDGGQQSRNPVSHVKMRNKPHRARGVPLIQRPYFQGKSGPVVGGTDCEAKQNLGGKVLSLDGLEPGAVWWDAVCSGIGREWG